jgi:16S rRNA (guanine527-N7)-methyltransferase
MSEEQAKELLRKELKFTESDIINLDVFSHLLLDYNSKYNLISKKTEKTIWTRHILDSAQLVKYFTYSSKANLVDFGSGAGFPGLILAIFNKNPEFHVKLYEKSPVKREFLNSVKNKIGINVEIAKNVYDEIIDADIIVSRAFKKIDQIISISREKVKKPHKIIILKGKNAQVEINNVSLGQNYSYKLENSITDFDSKIILIEAT